MEQCFTPSMLYDTKAIFISEAILSIIFTVFNLKLVAQLLLKYFTPNMCKRSSSSIL